MLKYILNPNRIHFSENSFSKYMEINLIVIWCMVDNTHNSFKKYIFFFSSKYTILLNLTLNNSLCHISFVLNLYYLYFLEIRTLIALKNIDLGVQTQMIIINLQVHNNNLW